MLPGWMLLLVLALTPASPVYGAAVPARLTLSDLVNHPERLPPYVTMRRTLRFSGGLTLRKGQKIHTVRFDGRSVLVTRQMTNFPLRPADTNLLAAANAVWAKLTPPQRAVDYRAIRKDASLWPARVTVLPAISIHGRRFRPKTEFTLERVGQRGVSVYDPATDSGITGVEIADTDLLQRARELARVPRARRPSRIVAELRGNLVDVDGAPAKVDFGKVRYFAVYYGADWCVWCHKTSPHLVRVMNEIGPRNPHLLFVMVDDDKNVASMYRYMKKEKMPWPAMSRADSLKVGVLRSARRTDPQLRILDRFGNELYDVPGGGPRQIRSDVAALMRLDRSGKAR